MKPSSLLFVGAWVTAVGIGGVALAPLALAGEPPLPQPGHQTAPAAPPAGGLSDADVERIALKIIEIQERMKAMRASGGAAADPDKTTTVDNRAVDMPPPPPPLPGFTTAPPTVAPAYPTLPPPAGAKETRFGLPLVAGPGGGYVAGAPLARGSGGGSLPGGGPSYFVDGPTSEERYFLLKGATRGSSGAGIPAGAHVVPGPSSSDRRGARLLSSDGHSASALQDDLAYGDRDRSLFLGTSGGFVTHGGAVPSGEIRSVGGGSYVIGGAAPEVRKYEQVVPGWVAMVSAQGKFSIAASSAANDTFKSLGIGRANTLQKGFNADSLDVSNKMGFGSLWGHVRAAYFSSPSGADSEVELLHAYGEAPFKEVPSDAKERLILRLGKSPVPLGLYNGSEWETWAWQARPLVYGRLFNGNLLGMGIDALVRPEVRDVRKDLVLRVGMFNGNSDSLPGFLTSSAANLVGYYPTDDRKRYSLTDFIYYADVAGVVDVTPSSASAFLVHGGAFALYGPNGTGEGGETLVSGVRGRLAWLRCRTPTPGVADGFLLETEWVQRDYHVDDQGANPARDLEDWGGYVSAIYTLDRAVPGRLSFGAKYDFVRSSGENYVAPGALTRAEDPLRADRTRWTGLLTWEPEPTMPVLGKFAFSLEYVYDEAEFLGEDKHSVILGLQVR